MSDLKSLQGAILEKGGECFIDAFDVAKERKVENFIRKILRRFHRIDMLINNAGWIHAPLSTEKIPIKDFKKSIETNLYAAFYFLRFILPVMKHRKKGIIVHIASSGARKGIPRFGGYVASKFAMRGMGETVAKETARFGVRTIIISPGGINTDMRKNIFGKDDAKRQQSPELVASIIGRVIRGGINVPNGSDIHIRKSKITRICRMEGI